jgi:hypothetical protein
MGSAESVIRKFLACFPRAAALKHPEDRAFHDPPPGPRTREGRPMLIHLLLQYAVLDFEKK